MKMAVGPGGIEGLACLQRTCTVGGRKSAFGYTDRVQRRAPASSPAARFIFWENEAIQPLFNFDC
jgi:hypothetical protein